MPSAGHDLQEKMRKWFGSPVAEEGPIKFLRSHGYVLTDKWFWIKPTPSYSISNDEYYCLKFLVDEWDFGGIWDPEKDGPLD